MSNSVDTNANAKPARRGVKAVPPLDPMPSAIDIDDRARMAEELKAALERVRKTALDWRTGMAGLLTLVTTVLLFKGQATITAYEPWVQYMLGVLTLLAVAAAIASLWLFLSAANGRMRAVSVQSIMDEGGVDVRNVNLTRDALADLTRARCLAVASAGLLAAAIAFSWYGPTAVSKPPAFAKLTVRSATATQPTETLCGELTALDGATAVLKIRSEPDARRLATPQLVSLVLVAACPSETTK